jgi:hypothetical protein
VREACEVASKDSKTIFSESYDQQQLEGFGKLEFKHSLSQFEVQESAKIFESLPW